MQRGAAPPGKTRHPQTPLEPLPIVRPNPCARLHLRERVTRAALLRKVTVQNAHAFQPLSGCFSSLVLWEVCVQPTLTPNDLEPCARAPACVQSVSKTLRVSILAGVWPGSALGFACVSGRFRVRLFAKRAQDFFRLAIGSRGGLSVDRESFLKCYVA